MRPTLTADGRRVRLPIEAALAPLVDDLAAAYADDPATVGRLLAAHAANVSHLDHVRSDGDASEPSRAMAAATADGTREAITEGLLPVDDTYGPDEAISLAGCITRIAAHIRHTSTKDTRA